MASSFRREIPIYGSYFRRFHIVASNPLQVESVWESLLYSARGCLRFSSSSSDVKRFDLTDLTRPHSWYPNARRKRRNVILHVGPTNSGKTHQALKRLELSDSGIYCGPLRLLACEVAKRMNKARVPCDLVTGQERELIDGAKHKAVTVEMADVVSEYKCAVIDEIQMISCERRGFSFTRALLGLTADELHLCGDPAVVPLVQEILKVTGDAIEVHFYERLSALIPSNDSLYSYSKIQTGDCVVTFSRHEIYKLKIMDFKIVLNVCKTAKEVSKYRGFHMILHREIEDGGKHLCSVVYGSLPPETRTRQASMFNDETSEFDVLVASDAIGMGLNLNISRVIFSTLKKFDGTCIRDLTVPEIKQIAGRAGRYGSKFPVGKVTCMYADDLPLLHSALQSVSPILERAGLFPTFDILSLYSRLHHGYSFHRILQQFLENAKLSPNFFITNCEEMLKIAAVIDEFPLTMEDKYVFCISPVDMNDDISAQGLIQFSKSYAEKGLVRLNEIFTPGMIQVPKSQKALKELESVHKVLDLYAWLSFRMDDSFPDRELASSQKAICSLLIEEFLDRLGGLKPMRKKLPASLSTKSILGQGYF